MPASTTPTGVDTNGVALLVTYQNTQSGTVRRVMIRDGAISSNIGGEIVSDTFTTGARPLATPGQFHLIVPDGQPALDGTLPSTARPSASISSPAATVR